jgi:DNA-binding response OmpR family regulator
LALLRGGADVVLPRPVSPQLLAEYARVVLRRSGAVPAFMLPRLDLEEISLDPATRTVVVSGRDPCRLTQLEFRLLYVLMTNREQVIPTEAIVERVWGYAGEGDRDLVRGLVSRLRHKIEPDPDKPRFIETLSGVGYRFSLESR